MKIKSPWTMVWSEYIDDFIAFIKANLPPMHELQSHDLFPGIKYSGEPIFIVDDDSTGKKLLIDFKNPKRLGNENNIAPTIKQFENEAEVEEMIERDHQKEIQQY